MGRDPAEFLLPDIGPTWPQEAHEVTLHDLKPELENLENAECLMEQLDSRGFAVIKSKGGAKGPLAQQKEWNKAFLEVCRMPFVFLRLYVIIQMLIASICRPRKSEMLHLMKLSTPAYAYPSHHKTE
jgi:hypothetical protein